MFKIVSENTLNGIIFFNIKEKSATGTVQLDESPGTAKTKL